MPMHEKTASAFVSDSPQEIIYKGWWSHGGELSRRGVHVQSPGGALDEALRTLIAWQSISLTISHISVLNMPSWSAWYTYKYQGESHSLHNPSILL